MAAGHSKFVCIYSVSDELLMKKFEICCNESLEGIHVQYLVLCCFFPPISYLNIHIIPVLVYVV